MGLEQTPRTSENVSSSEIGRPHVLHSNRSKSEERNVKILSQVLQLSVIRYNQKSEAQLAWKIIKFETFLSQTHFVRVNINFFRELLILLFPAQ